jgi:flagellar basal body-associated protein FliL
MFCKNCGKEIPDNAAHCPNCGTSQDVQANAAAPQQAAAPAPAPAAPKAPKAPININADFNKSVSVGGKKVELSLFNIIPMAMLVFVLIAMIGIHSFTFMSVRAKGEKKKDAAKYTYDYVIDELGDEKSLLEDDGFTSFMKFFEFVTEVVAIAGVLGCVLFINKDNILAMRSLAISGVVMFLSYFMLFIYAFHVKGEMKDSYDIKMKGGPTFPIILMILISLLVAAVGVLGPMVLKNDKKENAPAAPATPAGGFGGFNA